MEKNSNKTKALSFQESLMELRKRLATSCITTQDVLDNLPDVPPDLIELLLQNDATTFAEDIDKIFGFVNLKIGVKQSPKFYPYNIKVSDNGVRLICTRAIIPKCSIRYDLATGNYYDFKSKDIISPSRSSLIKSEMKLIVDDFLSRHKKNIKKLGNL